MQHLRNKQGALVSGQGTPVSPTEADIEMQRDEDSGTDGAGFWATVVLCGHLSHFPFHSVADCMSPLQGSSRWAGAVSGSPWYLPGVGAWVQGSVTDQRN